MWSQEEWRRELEEHPKFAVHFHLRACSGKITVVSTHPVKPMAGCDVSRNSLQRELEALAEAIDAGRIADHLQVDDRFKVRKKGQDEARFQARLISELNTSAAGALKEALGVKELRFISSEVVLYRKGDKSKKVMDVIALGDGKIYVIEMKTLQGNVKRAVEQVREYLNHYGSMKEFYDLVNLYLGDDLVAPGKTELAGVVMLGYQTGTAIDPEVKDGVTVLKYR